ADGHRLHRHDVPRADADQAGVRIRGGDACALRADVYRQRDHTKHGGHDAGAAAEDDEGYRQAATSDVSQTSCVQTFAVGAAYSRSFLLPISLVRPRAKIAT